MFVWSNGGCLVENWVLAIENINDQDKQRHTLHPINTVDIPSRPNCFIVLI